MNIDPNAPAFPTEGWDNPNHGWQHGSPGLTIRAELAARMMAGFAACPPLATDIKINEYARYSVLWADALIEELNKPTP